MCSSAVAAAVNRYIAEQTAKQSNAEPVAKQSLSYGQNSAPSTQQTQPKKSYKP
jgi:hypothetical protein